jgi:hypothetical protein
MGDASVQQPLGVGPANAEEREVTVLVTGYGVSQALLVSFNSFFLVSFDV